MANKLLIFSLIVVFNILKFSIHFEIEIINNDPGVNNFAGLNMNSAAKMFENMIADMERVIEDDEAEEKSHKKKKKKKKKKTNSPKSHKEIIQTSGPGFTTVEVREVISNSDNQDIEATDPLREKFSNTMSNINNDMNIRNSLNNSFDNLIQPMPFVFVNTRRNLKSHSDPTVNTPFRIFSDMNKIFDSFFKIDNQLQLNDINIKNTNIPSLPSKPGVEVLNVANLESDNKLIKIIPAEPEVITVNKISQAINQTSPQINAKIPQIPQITERPSAPDKEISNDLSFNIPHNNTNSTQTMTKAYQDYHNYLLFVSLIVIIFLFVFYICQKLLSIEKESKPVNTNHSINEIEDELKSMKDKNKLF